MFVVAADQYASAHPGEISGSGAFAGECQLSAGSPSGVSERRGLVDVLQSGRRPSSTTATKGADMVDIQKMTRHEAEALVEFIRDEPDESWDTSTVCEPWSVRHLVAHLTALSNRTHPHFATRMIASAFNFQKVVEGDRQTYLQTQAGDAGKVRGVRTKSHDAQDARRGRLGRIHRC